MLQSTDQQGQKSIKWVILWTGVVVLVMIDEWCVEMLFSDGLLGAQILELALHWNRLANGLQIHQIIKVPKTYHSIISLTPTICYHLSCLLVGPHQCY